MRRLLLMALPILWSCARSPAPPMAPLNQDPTITFPESFSPAMEIPMPGSAYDLDGETLSALITALDDFLPRESRDHRCWTRPEGYRYRFIRRDEVIFISIYADPRICQGKFLMLDSSVSYAISSDGRILRRLFTGEPDGASPAPEPRDAGMSEGLAKPDFVPIIPSQWTDGGTTPARLAPPASSPIDGGSSLDGGPPGGPPG